MLKFKNNHKVFILEEIDLKQKEVLKLNCYIDQLQVLQNIIKNHLNIVVLQLKNLNKFLLLIILYHLIVFNMHQIN